MPFEKGKSGNPGGRPKENAEVKALAKAKGKQALKKLFALMGCGDPRVELAAANSILDRGYGKPTQAISGDSEADPIQMIAEIAFVRAKPKED